MSEPHQNEERRESLSTVPEPANDAGPKIPFIDHLDIVLVEYACSRARFRLKIDDRHLRTLGILHGGVVTTLLDTSMGRAIRSVAPKGYHAVTVQLNANFIRPAWNGETIFAEGEVTHSGLSTAVAQSRITTEDGLLVASGSGTFMYLRTPDGETMEHLQQQDDARRGGGK